MLRDKVIVALITTVTALMIGGDAARILGIFPTASISHQVVFRGLMLGLQKRGHEIVIITPDPLNDGSLKNYTEIDVRFLYDDMPKLNWIGLRKKCDPSDFLYEVIPQMIEQSGTVLSKPEMKKMYEPNSKEHFDLIIVEVLFWHTFYPLIKRFDAPWIGISSLGLTHVVNYAIGSPMMPSHPSVWELGYTVSEPETFWKRVKDYYSMWRYLHFHHTTVIPHAERIARKYFGDYGSTITEIEKQMSVVFINQQLPISFVRPNLPQVIEMGGLHVSKETKPLPKALKDFLDEANEGFVYMSLGSNAKSTMLSDKARQAFITAFSRLPYKILWKFEEDVLPGKPDNVYTMKWIPQQSVLAHRNIKVFIYQGGLQSTEEAISHGVPLIGFPVLGDQDAQVLKMTSIGVCKQLEITDFTAEDLFEAVTTVATDPSYKERMLDLRSRIHDRPYDPLEHAAWWVEYVIRHRGISHLHSSTADLPWYQRGDADIVAFITAAFLISLSLMLAILYRSFVFLFMVSAVKRKEKST